MLGKRSLKNGLLITLVMVQGLTSEAMALAIDWHGIFGVDTTLIDTYKRYEGTSGAGVGPQNFNSTPNGNFNNATFQTYKLRLSPSIIINDSITFNGEITTGYGYGGRLGDSSTNKSDTPNFGNSLYFHNTYSANSNMIMSKFYAEVFSDTGTFIIGRQPFHWGLGAVFNDGAQLWDRHATIKDGMQAKFKLGNFQVSPYYFKTSAGGSLTKSTNNKEFGLNLLYDNPEKDLSFGVLFGKKKNNVYDTSLSSPTGGNLGAGEVKITDIYLRKAFSKLELSAEVPLFSGDVGNALAANTNAKYKAMGVIGRTKLALGESWTIGLDFGTLSGDDGVTTSFEAMYLHPNFHVANLMFRYNLNAVGDTTNDNVFDAYMTNVKYLKFGTSFERGSWKWDAAVVYAKANETATNGSIFYDQYANTATTAAIEDQSDDYGFEVDLDFTYEWNENFHLGGSIGYHFVGDFYKFDNIADSANQGVEIKDTYGLVLNAAISF